ncbi:MAG: broad specificity phosphatase PhoE [Planctomycetota bacterium]|jgi:broad specificity phosphatase PhoE
MKATRRQFVRGLGLGLAAPALASSTAFAQETAGKEAPEAALKAVLILVRHTEKSDDDRVDPSLSDAGKVRATELARTFGAAGVTGLVHTEYKRTHDTLAPMAEALELESETIGAQQMPKLLERLRNAKAGEVIAVAGHSNTIPAIAFAFGVLLPGLDPISKGSKAGHGNLPHGAYDRVHVLTPGKDGVSLMELRYGDASE